MRRVEHETEFIFAAIDYRCRDGKVILALIQSGKPTQNALVETCNSNIRKYLLNAYGLKTIDEESVKATELKMLIQFQSPSQSAQIQSSGGSCTD